MRKNPHLFIMIGIICSLSILVVGCSGLSLQSTAPSIEKNTMQGDILKTSVYSPVTVSTDTGLGEQNGR